MLPKVSNDKQWEDQSAHCLRHLHEFHKRKFVCNSLVNLVHLSECSFIITSLHGTLHALALPGV